MKYLLDTDVCIYWLKNREPFRSKIFSLGFENLTISQVTVAELYYGAYNSAPDHQQKNLDRLRQFVQISKVLEIKDSVLEHFGRLKASLRQQGQIVDDFDLLIASFAIDYDRILFTNNIRHYKNIPGLTYQSVDDMT
ncbi:MAG: PIN domain-containing protein [Prochlorotrichaceae cyanobacterium]|jgi:tRNA(fMet)-specific endonuclease VapC